MCQTKLAVLGRFSLFSAKTVPYPITGSLPTVKVGLNGVVCRSSNVQIINQLCPYSGRRDKAV